MFQKKFLILVFGLLFCTATEMAIADVFFLADFEDAAKTKAVPDKSVNDPAAWNKSAQTAGKAKWQLKGATLEQTENGCGNTTVTFLPDPKGTNKDWADFVFSADFTWRDNDGWGVVFRSSAPNKGYHLHVGASETAFLILGLTDKNCGKDGECFDANCETKDFIAKEAHKITVDEKGGTFYRLIVRAAGDSIKAWFDEAAKLKDPVSPTAKAVIDIKDGTHKKGNIGIWNESNVGEIDNITVLGGAGVAVEPKSKLATTWGGIKVTY